MLNRDHLNSEVVLCHIHQALFSIFKNNICVTVILWGINELFNFFTDNRVSPDFRRTIEDSCDKPFELRTESEKEELYEKIAEQLAVIADSYDFNSKFSSDLPPPKASTLFAPAPTPATTVVSPEIGDEDVISSSVDPPMPAPGQGEVDQDMALGPPQVIVQPGSPHMSNSGDQSPPLEGAVGGVNVTETGGNLLNPNQPCMFHSLVLFNSTGIQSAIFKNYCW